MDKERRLLINYAKHAILQELSFRSHNLKTYDWQKQARSSQLIPKGKWGTWLILAGRGFGKTRAGAETVRQWATQNDYRRIALIGDTQSDVRDIMVEGESGLLAIHPDHEKPIYEPSKRRLKWKNGTVAHFFSAEDYEKLRGPQFAAAWIDELAKFRQAEKVWQQLQFSLRLGKNPKVVITTTPRPHPLLKNFLKNEGDQIVITRGHTFENEQNLSADFLKIMRHQYEGTCLGLQELGGEMLNALEGALWTHELLDECRFDHTPVFSKMIISIDPAVTHHEKSDETGIIVAAITSDQKIYVLEDLSGKYSPTHWAQIAIKAYYCWKADFVIAEVNQGGDLVEKILKSVDPTLPYKALRATKGKLVRAEPIAALYEQHKVFHKRQGLEKLENQMCSFTGQNGLKSPDRLDALVWAISELMFGKHQRIKPKIWKI